MKKSFYLNSEIVVIGLGYVGLPLAVKLSSSFKVIGYDKLVNRIKDLKQGKDLTNEVKAQKLNNNINLTFTNNKKDILRKNIYIVTVPTPVKQNNKPDLSFLRQASRLVGESMNKFGIVIFESTVYPGVTEKICGAIIEKVSGFKLNKSFFLGYSPERINPGDKNKTLTEIIKITSGSNEQTLNPR